ncbi:endo--beta [Plasmopara halstedii]|uniref:glucan endo-1,3-beta-D-glucosidase n=1 Tax=Plasmopara halstedii TaxID=4781 RepID=A0A0P1B0B1_PLAHL|nr:endo--beta [Plasmopara halstedii]CEG46910.1 endo--beta [Plasmopara halstedii]|eukprot:XP_024583279.1 endo--beta [Plasmopara halstedii]
MLSFNSRARQDREVNPLLQTHSAPLSNPKSSNRLNRWSMLTVVATLLFTAAVFGVFQSRVTTLRSATTIAADVKFDLFQPIFNAEAPPQSLFNHTDEQKNLLPPRFLAPGIEGSRPIPTNDWWGNMIGATTGNEEIVQPVWTNPYSVTPSPFKEPFGLTLNYPYTTRLFGGGLTGNGDAEMYYLHGQIPEFTFSAMEFSSSTRPTLEVFDWDDLTVHLRFVSSQDSSKKVESTLASGMAFVTARYAGLTPRFQTFHNISTINGLDATETASRPLINNRFVLTFDNKATWNLYFSDQVTLHFDGHSSLEMKMPFTGIARVALIPDASAEEQRVFDLTANCVLDGGRVEAYNDAAYAYQWKTSGDCSNGMLHYAQVHHVDTMDRRFATEAQGVAAHSTTRGLMQGIVTKTSPAEWRMVDPVDFPVDFYPSQKPKASIVESFEIKENLIADIDSEWTIALGQSYYFNGKAAQKYASLCLMAGDPSIVGEDDTKLLSHCIKKLEGLVAPFLTNAWTNALNYDTIYRGIVSSQGFTLHDPNVDFGNTMYNDHHYHYGYWVVTAAIINKLDPTWSGIPALNRMAGFLVRDVANPSDVDPNFPKFRSFDWFRGHSYSHGITALGDGKDEESTSEDINFYYGMTLLGKVTKDVRLETVGKLMVKLNARAIQTYFLIEDGNRAHPDHYRDNRVMGILFDNKVNYATWFSGEKYAIHGIQMLPATAVTEYVRTYDFVEQEWNEILSRESIVQNDELTNPWLSLLYMNYATVNKDFALQKLRTVKMDDGLSRSWAMYIAATRP